MAEEKVDISLSLRQLEDTLNLYFSRKAPAMPKGLKEFIVVIVPWLILISIIASIPTVLSLLGMRAFIPFGFLGPIYPAYNNIIFLVFTLAFVVLETLSLPGLFNRTKQGWNYVFYASLVSVIENLVLLNIGGFVIGSLIGFYIIFQVREYYK